MWLAFALAVAAETQVTGLQVVASGLAVVIGAEWRSGVMRALKQAGLAGLIVWASVWAVYLVLDPAMLSQMPLLVPRPYLDGIGYLAVHDTTESSAYIAGIAYTGGRWWYWPLSLVIKWPGAALLLLVAGVLGCLRLPLDLRRRGLAVVLPAALITGFTLTTPKDVGVRYLLTSPRPVGGAAASGLVAVLGSPDRGTAQTPGRNRRGRHARRGGRSALPVLPGSIAWTAWPFRPGYTMATDSNIDWGQGLYALRSWSASRDPWVAYFGPRGITIADILGARPLPGTAPTRVDGWVAASVTALNSANRSSLNWLRAWCPVGILDGTILVYHFSRPPTSTSAQGPPPPRPAPLCPGPWSSAR